MCVCASDFLMERWGPGARLDLNLVPSVLLAMGLHPLHASVFLSAKWDCEYRSPADAVGNSEMTYVTC